MAQQPQTTSQWSWGPVNVGGDIVHINPASANATPGNLIGWVDNHNLAQGVSGVVNAFQQVGTPASSVVAAAATVVFTTVPINVPGNSAYEQVPFTVKASGWITLNGGTYTATVQPLIYAGAPGFTASVAAAVLSTAGVPLTIAVAATATNTTFPWEAEVVLVGNSTSNSFGGRIPAGALTVGPSGSVAPVPLPAAPAAVTNPAIQALTMSAAAPVQLLIGVGVTGATVSAGTVHLGSFFMES